MIQAFEKLMWVTLHKVYACATSKMLVWNWHDYSQFIWVAVWKGYLVCMVWPDPLSRRAFIAYSVPELLWYYQLQIHRLKFLLLTRPLGPSKLGFEHSLGTASRHNRLSMPVLNSEMATHNQTLYSDLEYKFS